MLVCLQIQGVSVFFLSNRFWNDDIILYRCDLFWQHVRVGAPILRKQWLPHAIHPVTN